MHLRINTRCLMFGFVSLMTAIASQAAVTLNYNDGDALPTSTIALAGGTFTVNVQLVSNSSSDTVNGLSYQALASTGGVIKFVSRTIASSSPFQFPNAPTTPPTIVLNPDNGTDLGAAENDVSASVSQGTFAVASLTFQVLNTAIAGTTYTLSFDNAAFGHPYPSTVSSSFSQPFGTYSVTVVAPEPTTLSLMSLAVPALALRRRSALR